MSLDKNRILLECAKCGLIFRVDEKTANDEEAVLCDLIPEKDLGSRKRKCQKKD